MYEITCFAFTDTDPKPLRHEWTCNFSSDTTVSNLGDQISAHFGFKPVRVHLVKLASNDVTIIYKIANSEEPYENVLPAETTLFDHWGIADANTRRYVLAWIIGESSHS